MVCARHWQQDAAEYSTSQAHIAETKDNIAVMSALESCLSIYIVGYQDTVDQRLGTISSTLSLPFDQPPDILQQRRHLCAALFRRLRLLPIESRRNVEHFEERADLVRVRRSVEQ